MKKSFAVMALIFVVGAMVVPTVAASQPGSSPYLTVAKKGLIAGNGAQVVVSGTFLCPDSDATTFTLTTFVSQGGSIDGNAQGVFSCVPGAPAAWTLIVNASLGTFKNGKASANTSAIDNGTIAEVGLVRVFAQLSLG